MSEKRLREPNLSVPYRSAILMHPEDGEFRGRIWLNEDTYNGVATYYIFDLRLPQTHPESVIHFGEDRGRAIKVYDAMVAEDEKRVTDVKGSAKLICDYCQRWNVRRYRGVFRMSSDLGWDAPYFYPNLEYQCPTCGATEFSYEEPTPSDVEQRLNAERV